jgi:putative oxidoreductase
MSFATMSHRLDQNAGLRDVGLLLLRLILAVVFVYHGSQKLFGWFGGYGLTKTADAFGSMNFPLPMASAIAAASAEFFGAILLALGLFFRPAALVMAFTMFVASYVHLVIMNGGFQAPKGMEYPLTLAIALLALAFTGPGRIALGRMIWR